MKKLLIALATMAIVAMPAAADAAGQCRDSATGKFAKCTAAGAVPAEQYVAKSKTLSKSAMKPSMKAKPAMASSMAATPAAKPAMMPMPKGTMTPAATMTPAPAMKSGAMTKSGAMKAARCKTAKGKFVKCGTPGAMPA